MRVTWGHGSSVCGEFPWSLTLPLKGGRKVSGQEAKGLGLALGRHIFPRTGCTGTLGVLASLPAPPSSVGPLHLTARLLPGVILEPLRLLQASAAIFRPHVALPPPVQPALRGHSQPSQLERVSSSVSSLMELFEGSDELYLYIQLGAGTEEVFNM